MWEKMIRIKTWYHHILLCVCVSPPLFFWISSYMSCTKTHCPVCPVAQFPFWQESLERMVPTQKIHKVSLQKKNWAYLCHNTCILKLSWDVFMELYVISFRLNSDTQTCFLVCLVYPIFPLQQNFVDPWSSHNFSRSPPNLYTYISIQGQPNQPMMPKSCQSPLSKALYYNNSDHRSHFNQFIHFRHHHQETKPTSFASPSALSSRSIFCCLWLWC